MVQSLLGVDRRFDSFDATDALAVAICHATRLRMLELTGTQ
jgi:Holliday junction resolvasome RuvABC endonuclease subunit